MNMTQIIAITNGKFMWDLQKFIDIGPNVILKVRHDYAKRIDLGIVI